LITPFAWFIAAGPAALIALAVVGGRSGPITARAVVVGLLNLCLAAATAIAVGFRGVIETGTAGVAGAGFGLYLDSLSAAMFCLVSFVGVIVIAYSKNYMEGDPGQSRFTRLLCVTLASVLIVILSGNLLQFSFAWIATSVGLQALLLFYPERHAAVLAGRKKFIASRLGELCVIAASLLIYQTFHTLDYGQIFTAARGMAALHGNVPAIVHSASALLVVAALLKSAQFPMHGWLTEVMETPTPVSALLHAGIINAGGFLILRLSSVVSLSTPSLEFLAIVGGFTALFGSVVMLTQTSIKVSLAFSTVAQMGFMMLECGLAAFPAALLHIIAHSLYKAHAFLSSGSVIDIARASWTPSPGGKPHPARLTIAIAAVLALAYVLGKVFGQSLTDQPAVFTLGAVLLLGLVHLIASSIDERPKFYVVARTAIYAIAVGGVYFGLQFVMEHVFASSLPVVVGLQGPFAVAVALFIIVSFAFVILFQGLVPRDDGRARWRGIYALIANGLYVNTFANRLVLRFWPPRAATSPRLTLQPGADA
jgi:NAD(P)H-quinone oxidoreductase subunit 5